ncbi:MAG: hypothetical protein INF88_04110 [Roseomonas sp.]|nr:hypothetical protein [Roseomonas sp.]
MRIVEKYSHLNGLEFLLVHKPKLWAEIEAVIASVDAQACKTKISKEVRSLTRIIHDPLRLVDCLPPFSAEANC